MTSKLFCLNTINIKKHLNQPNLMAAKRHEATNIQGSENLWFYSIAGTGLKPDLSFSVDRTVTHVSDGRGNDWRGVSATYIGWVIRTIIRPLSSAAGLGDAWEGFG